MLKKIFLSTLIAISTSLLCAQSIDSTAKLERSKPVVPAKKYYHLVGFQINDLLHQAFSLGTTFSPNNPYQLVYSLQPANSRYRLQTGLGYSKTKIKDIDDRVSRGDTLFFRAGIARTFPIHKRITAALGADLLYNHGSIYTESASGFSSGSGSFDSTFTTTHSTFSQYGGGFQLNISYQLTTNFYIGTELNYYLKFFNAKENITANRIQNISGTPGNEVNTTTIFNDKSSGNQWVFTKPVSIILSLRF